jgi:ribosomal protein S18 acetylase RimI-like enzyme
MNITKPTLKDIPAILEVTKACAKHMITNEIFQWNENYPSYEAFEKDIQLNQLWVLKDKNRIIGSIVISAIMDEEYHDIDWLTSNTKNIYIHRLSIHPDFQGKGCAQQLMSYAESYAKKQ